MTQPATPVASLRFLGATNTVTGSRFLLQVGRKQVLVDCGLFQGLKELRERNWQPMPVQAHDIDAVVLTHAHIDHSGYLPRLVKEGFRGDIYATPATRDLCRILLPDAARIQEEDAAYANRKGFSKHSPALPLYTEEEAQAALKRFHTVRYRERFDLDHGLAFAFTDAGHILGSASAHFEIATNGGSPVTVRFSGDVGRYHQPVTTDPAGGGDADYLVVESTYGDRLHAHEDTKAVLAGVVNRTVERGGHLVIPAFALGRTQHLLYLLREMEEEHRIPNLPVFVDSPMATQTTEVYLQHAAELDAETRAVIAKHRSPFRTSQTRFVASVGESKQVSALDTPTIVVSASGMATGGRVLHHLSKRLPDPRNTVLLAGFQAAGTRGRRLLDHEPEVKIHGQWVPVRAEIAQINSLSAHADANELMRWLRSFKRAPRRTYVVHGEPEASTTLATRIRAELGWDVVIPTFGELVELTTA